MTYQGQILRETEVAAGKLDIQLQTFGVRGPDEFERTFEAITSGRAATLLVLPDPVLSLHGADRRPREQKPAAGDVWAERMLWPVV